MLPLTYLGSPLNEQLIETHVLRRWNVDIRCSRLAEGEAGWGSERRGGGEEVGREKVYLDLALIFLLFLFSLRILFFLHFALIFQENLKIWNRNKIIN